ncbi:MAG: MarR family winged helix-turn-helix transcriptional regulator, partial [Dermatophilaceae bacterium]
ASRQVRRDDPTTAVDLDHATGYLLKQVDVALRAEMDRVLRPLDLTTPQYAVLEVLAQRPGLSAAGLARATFVTRQTMTAIVRGLEERGLVRADPGSRGRAQPMSLTPRGRRALRPASVAVGAVEARLVRGLTPRRRAELDVTLRRCLGNLTTPDDR